MAFMLRNPTSRRYREALEGWRSAAEIAHDRWTQFSVAERASRPFMFAAYLAALDREEAAAAELALLSLDRAA
jgi:predicted N-acyltransferase